MMELEATPEELAEKFEPSAQPIRNRVCQSKRRGLVCLGDRLGAREAGS